MFCAPPNIESLMVPPSTPPPPPNLKDAARSLVPPQDLLHIYYALVCSVLEYCCVIWHNSLPKYLSKNIEMVQKRPLRIILPETSHSEALAKLNCPRLDDRRTFLCQKAIRNIASGGYLSRHLPQTRERSPE